MVMNFLKSIFTSPFPSMDARTYLDTHFGKPDHVLIDVRTAQEFKSGHIPGAKNIPLDQLGKQLKSIPNNKPVIVVCQSGNRSRSACHTLWNAGYQNITNFKGGTFGWRMLGQPLK
jgi:rhodanese-related sulfurtransferase